MIPTENRCFQTRKPLLFLLALMVSGVIAPSAGFAWEYDLWMTMRHIVPKGYVSYYTKEPVKVDGKLDDPCWRLIPFTDYFGDLSGDVKRRPLYRTQAKMIWDDTYLYIAVEMEEPDVRTTFLNNDTHVCDDNDIEVFIDPNADNHEYYEIEVNPVGAVWDLLYRQNQFTVFRFQEDPADSWDVKGMITGININGTLNDPRDYDSSWSVELAIPWKVFSDYAYKSLPPRDGDQWRINFSRVQYIPEVVTAKNSGGGVTNNAYRNLRNYQDNWVWSPQGNVGMHRPERWGYIQFSTGKPGLVAFKPDYTEPARCVLYDIYFAQRDFHTVYGQYAKSLEELGIPFNRHESIEGDPVLAIDGERYRAGVKIKRPNGTVSWLYVDQDLRILSK